MSNRNNISSDNGAKEKMVPKIVIPFELMRYLANDRNFSKPGRRSKLEAFKELAFRYLANIRDGVDPSRTVTELQFQFGWARPTVISYVNTLQEMGVVMLEDSKDGKMVTVNPDIFR